MKRQTIVAMNNRNLFKKFLFLVLPLFLMHVMAMAQQEGFFVQYSDERQDLCGVESLELDGGGYITAAFNFHHEWGSYNDTTPARLFLLSEEGELLKSQTLSEGRRSTIVGLYADPEIPDLFYAVGKVRDLSGLCDRPYLAKFDGELNILSFDEIELPEQVPYFFMGNSIMDSQGDIVYFTIPYSNPYGPSTNGRIYMRLNREEGLVAYYHDDVSYVGEFDEGSLCETNDGSGDYLHLVRSREGYNHTEIHRMDRDFNLLETYEFGPARYQYSNGMGGGSTAFYNDQYWTMLPVGSDSVLVSVEVLVPEQQGMEPESAMLYKADFYGNAPTIQLNTDDWTFSASAGMLLFGFYNDSIEGPARMKSLDVSPADGNLIHCNGVYHRNEYGSRLTVTKVDPAVANVSWKRTLNMGVFVEPMFVLATRDGGCLITGYSHRQNEEQRSFFALKLNSEGFLEVEDQAITVVPYHLFPNPTRNQFFLRYSPDVTPKRVELHDVLGRLVGTQNSNLESIDMSNLPAGPYTLRIVMGDGTTYSDKVIKQ